MPHSLTSEGKFERTKLAVETRLRRADQQFARKQFALAEAQFAWEMKRDSQRGWRFLTSPVGVVVLVAAIGLVGTAVGKWADYLNTKKQQETTVILKASEVPQSLSPENQDVQRARNILWFAKAGYIHLPNDFINQMQTAAKLAPGQTLPPPVVQLQTGAGADLEARFEGFRSTPHLLPYGGIQVIGFGHTLSEAELSTGHIQVGTESIPFVSGISEEQARRILDQDMVPAYKTVDDLIKVPLTPAQRDALADLVWDIGSRSFARSSLVTLLNQGKYEEVPVQLKRWTVVRGRELPGLKLRRQAEIDLWKRPQLAQQSTSPKAKP
jgi:GH24 family phage-related lysozyme (muramidase)